MINDFFNQARKAEDEIELQTALKRVDEEFLELTINDWLELKAVVINLVRDMREKINKHH